MSNDQEFGQAFDWKSSTHRAMSAEIEALQAVRQAIQHGELGGQLQAFCERVLNLDTQMVLMGIGKSGHVARKIAATLSSVLTPTIFVHPTEAGHGDLGLIGQRDIVLLLSKSGATEELLTLLPALEARGCFSAAITCSSSSPLAKRVDCPLNLPEIREACQLDLAPTSSTTAMLALGDAIAVALSEARGLTPENFAHTHPSGRLGRRLLTRLRHLIDASRDLPWVTPDMSIAQVLPIISKAAMGFALIGTERMCDGVFTDGDLRRALSGEHDIHSTSVSEVMTRDFVSVQGDSLAYDALKLMQEQKISALIVQQEGAILGVIQLHELVQADLA